VPDLPDANYQLWVRGYGLQDSQKVAATPGESIDLAAIVAPDAATAAQVYPAAYWYAMLDLPTEEEVADIPGGMNNYLMWTKNMGCVGCHQMGQMATRTLPEGYGVGESSQEAWARPHSYCRDYRSNTWPTGPTASRRARSRRKYRNGRAVSKETWWRQCATGRARIYTCMISRVPTAATRR
jgi:hypothetical protein